VSCIFNKAGEGILVEFGSRVDALRGAGREPQRLRLAQDQQGRGMGKAWTGPYSVVPITGKSDRRRFVHSEFEDDEATIENRLAFMLL
jgi:hypothetical protein